MVQIRKKTGLVQSFDSQKIIDAVKKSADRVNVEMSPTKNNRLIELVLEKIKDKEVIDVVDLHKFVELALDEVDQSVAKSYREYRNYKLQFVKMLDEVYRKKLSLDNTQDASNANADSSLVTTQKAITYNELNSELYRRFFLTDEEEKAMVDGYIYIHDRGSRLDASNCFERSTRFITSNGVKSFYDFTEGDTVKVLSHKGVWRKAKVVKLPWSKIHRVWFKRASSKETFVDCTLDHRWILKDGSITQNIKVGDTLISTPDITSVDFDSLDLYYKKLWCLGFGFADGSVNSKKVFTEQEKLKHTMRIRLCGKKVRFLDNFIKSGYTYGKVKDSEDIIVYMNDIHSKILPYNMDETSIKVFMDGYLNADGERNLSFNSTSEYRGLMCVGRNNDWMRDFLNISGHYITRINDLSGQETNYGIRKENTLSYSFYSSSGDRNWKVTKIEQRKLNPKANVWCLDVEEDHSFILEKGIPTGNCCLFDMKSVLTGGFEMGNMHYNEPKSIGVAFSVMLDVIFNAGSSQYGGFTVSEVDKLLAPYAEKSYTDYYKEYEDIKGKVDPTGANIYATNKLKREIEQHVQAMEMKLNSCETSRGDYIFTSISFGLSKDRFGQMISSAILKVRKEGQGQDGFKRPVLFPKLTFMYDENLHGVGKELEWLFLEAVDCTMKAQYPDFLSMTGDGYAPSIYKKYGVTISRMGCVSGKHLVTYKVKGENSSLTTSFEDLWNLLSQTKKVNNLNPSNPLSSDFIELQDIEVLDINRFVDCKRIIKNPTRHDWYKVTLENESVIYCTGDHYWTVDNQYVVQTTDLNVFDKVPTVKEDKMELVGIKEITYIGDYEDYSYDFSTESEHFNCDSLRSHNCRANLSPWYERGGIEPADEEDRPRYEGRFNMGAVSLNFPMIVAKAKEENKDFFKVLEYYLDLCRKIHLRTLEYFSHKKAGINPLAFCQGGFYKGHKNPDEELGRDFLKPCTVSFGITALNEATVMYNGKTIYEDKSEFAEKVLRFINDYANKYKKIDGVLYAIYGTPGESLCFCSGVVVQCYGGNKEIQDVKKGDLVFSYNERLNKIELKPVIESRCTNRSAEVVEVGFTDGSSIRCTPNHPFALRKRVDNKEIIEYVRADSLVQGQRIKSNYRRVEHGRMKFSTAQLEQNVVAEYFYGEKPEGFVLHHIDENKLNNKKENIVYMSDSEHRRFHMKNTILPYCYTKESQKGENNTFYGKHHKDYSKHLNRIAHLGSKNVSSKPVAQYTLDDILINVFESRGIAERSTGFKNISYACNGVSTHSLGSHVAYGYKWYFTKDVENFAEENHTVSYVKSIEGKFPVYNIEVADNHNYYVGGDNGVLVHNCSLQVKQFRKKYGVIKGVSDKEYMSNSFHMHVSENITPIEKQDAEYKCFHLCNGGNIMYNRFTSEYNKESFVALIRRAMKLGYYYGCNQSKDYCKDCGKEFIDLDKCPSCGSENIVRIERVCGYLSYSRIGDKTRMNDGKLEEIKDRKSM